MNKLTGLKEVDINDVKRIKKIPQAEEILWYKIESIKKQFDISLMELENMPTLSDKIIPINFQKYIPPSTGDRLKRFILFLMNNEWYQEIILEEFEVCHIPAFESKFSEKNEAINVI